MAYDINDPWALNRAGYFDLVPAASTAAASPTAGALSGQQPAAAAPAATSGALSGSGGSAAPNWGMLQQFLDPQYALPIAAALIGGANPQASLAGAAQVAGQAVPQMRQRAALNAYLKSQSGLNLTPEEQQLLANDPQLAAQVVAYSILPQAPVFQQPGTIGWTRDPKTGQWTQLPGASGQRGGGTKYDMDAAAAAYDAQYGPAANRDINAPNFSDWYRTRWPTYGQPGDPYAKEYGVQPPPPDTGAAAPPPPAPAASVPPLQQPPPRTIDELQRALTPAAQQPAPQSTQQPAPAQASNLPRRGYSESDIRRFDQASNAVTKSYMALPGYQLVASGAPYLSRIESASKEPGSISDQELLDSVTKLNNAGGQVTDAQVKLVLEGQSLSDKAAVWAQQLASTGGVLSPDQRKQLIDVAHAVYAGYQQMYQPIYDAAKKQMKAQGIPEAFQILPDLNELSRTAGIAGGSGNAPAIGAVEQGYRFNGGDPADPRSWTPVQ